MAGLVPGTSLVAGAAPEQTWTFLTTGNGYNFSVYDANQLKITTFLEHPYRYLRAGSDPMSDGVGRRNLAYDFYFGIRGASGTAWLNGGAASSSPEYTDQSNLSHPPIQAAGVNADVYYFAPFGYEGNALIALVHAPGATAAFSLFNFHMGSTANSDTDPGTDGEALSHLSGSNAVMETGPGGGAMIYVPIYGVDQEDCNNVYNAVAMGSDLGSNTSCAGNDIVPAFEKKLASDGWWAVAIQYTDDVSSAPTLANALVTWANNRAPAQILSDAQAEFETWRVPPPAAVQMTSDEMKTWRQGEAVLRMGQIREPNTASRKNNGMILASLPPGEWHTGWVRDMTYSTVALSRSGHYAEAKAALDFYMAAGPVGTYSSYENNQAYRISVCRYYGDGSEQADYSGQPTPNVEIDGWGLVMWAARQYVDASGDVGWLSETAPDGRTNYDVLTQSVAGALAANLESNGIVKADSSIWEVHDGNKRHFAYTSLAAARGFCDMATMAQRAGKPDDVTKYQALSNGVVNGFFGVFLDPVGAIAGSLEGLQQNVYTDASVVEAFNWSILPDFTGKIATATLSRLNQLKVESGGFKRNDSNSSSYDNNEWILIDLRISDAFRRAGQPATADALINQVVSQAAANFYLLPELYNAVAQDGQIGIYTGSIPMVGYGGGTFLMTLLDRAGLTEPIDCGSSTLTDAGVVQSDGGVVLPGGGSDAGTTVNVPYVTACLCTLPGGVGGRPGLIGWLAAPWLLLAVRLIARRRRSAKCPRSAT